MVDRTFPNAVVGQAAKFLKQLEGRDADFVLDQCTQCKTVMAQRFLQVFSLWRDAVHLFYMGDDDEIARDYVRVSRRFAIECLDQWQHLKESGGHGGYGMFHMSKFSLDRCIPMVLHTIFSIGPIPQMTSCPSPCLKLSCSMLLHLLACKCRKLSITIELNGLVSGGLLFQHQLVQIFDDGLTQMFSAKVQGGNWDIHWMLFWTSCVKVQRPNRVLSDKIRCMFFPFVLSPPYFQLSNDIPTWL